MMAVVIFPKFFANGFQFCLVRTQIHGRHGLEISGVEAWRQDCVLDGILGGNGIVNRLFSNCGGRDHQFQYRLTPI